MELFELKRGSDDIEDASTPAEVAAAVTVTASVEQLHPADDDVQILDDAWCRNDSAFNRT